MSLRNRAAQLNGITKQTLERIGIIHKRNRARGSKAGKNRQKKIKIIEGHRLKSKYRTKQESVLTEIRFGKSEPEQTLLPKLTLW